MKFSYRLLIVFVFTFGLVACASPKARETIASESSVIQVIECTEPRPRICTREYRPVCAVKDTGTRCVNAPCSAATEKVTYATGCTACADPKVYRYTLGECK